jgi:hypothetical protein
VAAGGSRWSDALYADDSLRCQLSYAVLNEVIWGILVVASGKGLRCMVLLLAAMNSLRPTITAWGQSCERWMLFFR